MGQIQERSNVAQRDAAPRQVDDLAAQDPSLGPTTTVDSRRAADEPALPHLSGTDQMNDSGQSTDAATRLCLECGLCCQGVLHRQAVLRPDETRHASELGLEVVCEAPAGRHHFSLPCPAFSDSGCSIYESRPHVCGEYACHLLERLRNGDIELDRALDVVAEAKRLIRRLPETAREENGVSIWDAVVDGSSTDGSDAEVRLDMGELLVLLRREFKPRQGSGSSMGATSDGGPDRE